MVRKQRIREEREARGGTYLNKDTISCGCVNAVVRGDGTRKGIDENEAWLGRQDESY